MKESKNITIETKPTDRVKGFWLNSSYVKSSLLKESILKADILFLPVENIRGVEGPMFPAGTENFYQYLKEATNYQLELCSEEEDYTEYSFHSGILIILGSFLVAEIVAPVFVELVSEYLKKRIFKEDPKQYEVRFQLTIEGKDKSTEIRYEGPADIFEKSIKNYLSADHTEQIANRIDGKD